MKKIEIQYSGSEGSCAIDVDSTIELLVNRVNELSDRISPVDVKVEETGEPLTHDKLKKAIDKLETHDEYSIGKAIKGSPIFKQKEKEIMEVLDREEMDKISEESIEDMTKSATKWFGLGVKCKSIQADAKLAHASLFAFMGWLTCRDKPVTLSGNHNAAIAAELVDEFAKANKLPQPDKGMIEQFSHPKSMRVIKAEVRLQEAIDQVDIPEKEKETLTSPCKPEVDLGPAKIFTAKIMSSYLCWMKGIDYGLGLNKDQIDGIESIAITLMKYNDIPYDSERVIPHFHKPPTKPVYSVGHLEKRKPIGYEPCKLDVEEIPQVDMTEESIVTHKFASDFMFTFLNTIKVMSFGFRITEANIKNIYGLTRSFMMINNLPTEYRQYTQTFQIPRLMDYLNKTLDGSPECPTAAERNRVIDGKPKPPIVAGLAVKKEDWMKMVGNKNDPTTKVSDLTKAKDDIMEEHKIDRKIYTKCAMEVFHDYLFSVREHLGLDFNVMQAILRHLKAFIEENELSYPSVMYRSSFVYPEISKTLYDKRLEPKKDPEYSTGEGDLIPVEQLKKDPKAYAGAVAMTIPFILKNNDHLQLSPEQIYNITNVICVFVGENGLKSKLCDIPTETMFKHVCLDKKGE